MASDTSTEFTYMDPEEVWWMLNLPPGLPDGALQYEGEPEQSEASQSITLSSVFILPENLEARSELLRRMWDHLVKHLNQWSDPWLGKRGEKFESTEATDPLVKGHTDDLTYSSEILSYIYAEPVEDGYSHPAERLISKSLVSHAQETITWLDNIVRYEKNPSVVAGILTCLGRLDLKLVGDWGFELAEAALKHQDVEVRDAAVQMMELWGTEKAVGILERHVKSEQVDWLRDYIESVVEDLKES